MPDIREALLKQIEAGQENALGRFTLGRMALADGDAETAIAHLERAIALDGRYSAAFALLGKAHQQAGDTAAAVKTYADGAAIAEKKGDLQAAKQMRVFLKKLSR